MFYGSKISGLKNMLKTKNNIRNMKRITIIFICLSIFKFSNAQYEGYSSSSWENQLNLEELFFNYLDKTSFKKHLKKLTERPHVVGSETNQEVIRYIGDIMENAGLEVTNYPYDVYLPNKPGTSLIEIVTPSREVLNQISAYRFLMKSLGVERFQVPTLFYEH